MKFRETLQNTINFFTSYGERYMTNTNTSQTKVPNYTDDMVRYMVAEYTETPHILTVERLEKELGRNKRSIIAKLVREGVYKAQPRVTKRGAPIVRKSELVAQIQENLGVEVPTLEKASKADLERLVSVVVTQ